MILHQALLLTITLLLFHSVPISSLKEKSLLPPPKIKRDAQQEDIDQQLEHSVIKLLQWFIKGEQDEKKSWSTMNPITRKWVIRTDSTRDVWEQVLLPQTFRKSIEWISNDQDTATIGITAKSLIPRWKQEIRRYLQGLDSTQSVPPLTLINKTHASFPSSPDFNHTVPSNPSLWRSLTIIRTWRENIDEIFRFLATHPPQLSGKSRTPNNRSPDREVLTTLWYLLIQQWNELMVIESSTLSLLSSYLDEDEMLNDIILLSDHWHWLLVFLYQPKEMFTEFMNNLQAIQVDYDSGDIRVKRIVNHWMYRILLIVSPDVYVHSFTRWQSEANQGESATTDEEHVDETTVAILEEVGLQMTSLILSIAFDYKLNEIKSLLQHSVIVRELLDDRRRNVSGCTHTRYPSVLNEINRWNIGWNPYHFSLLNDTRTADNPTIPLYPQQAIEEGLSYVSVLLHANKEHFFDPLDVLTKPTKEFSWKYLTFKRRNTRSFGQQSLLTPSRVGLAVIAVTAIGAIQLLL